MVVLAIDGISSSRVARTPAPLVAERAALVGLGGGEGGLGGGGLGGGGGGGGGIDGAGIITGAVSTTTSMPFSFVRKVFAFAGVSILVASVTVRSDTHVLLASASASVSGAAISAVTLIEAAVTVTCQPPHART